MTSVNYPNPVTVNGYSCKNCTDVDYAKKNIDPAHPKDGPYGIDKTDNSGKPGAADKAPGADYGAAVIFGGKIAELVAANSVSTSSTAATLANANSPQAVGGRLDLSA